MMKNLIIWCIRIYQKIVSPLFGNICRFTPSCSNYCIDAITAHGIGKGLFLSLRRIVRCHPFCSGGYDPVEKKPSDLIVKTNR